VELAPETEAWPTVFTEASGNWNAVDGFNFNEDQKGPGCVRCGWGYWNIGESDPMGLLFKIVSHSGQGKDCVTATKEWIIDKFRGDLNGDVEHAECTTSLLVLIIFHFSNSQHRHDPRH